MAEDNRDQESLDDVANEQAVEGQESSDVVEDAAMSASDDGDGGSSLESQIEQLEEELGQAKDQALRAQADAQNAHRRADQDVEKARKFALERFCSELLPVVDNLERALEAINSDDPALSSITEGVDLTLKSFVGALS
ncbi:nucleotide exchange factor GrpE, partial [Congregibacter sp.]|uniref:nucleotide exchange factor GrpE n=1 Tax=Congregibacter sp. TaxID=2744308 RepID=UPI003F6D9ACE